MGEGGGTSAGGETAWTSQRDRWGAGRWQTDVWERDLERLLTLHQAQGKSNQAISKPRRSAPATLAPHNYNTIWQRYWAQIPCYFCGCVYSARTRFYIKVPKMALTLTYWKERRRSQAERANSKNMLSLRSPGEKTQNVTDSLIFQPEVEGVFLKRWPLPPRRLVKGTQVNLCRVESEGRKEQLVRVKAGWGKDTERRSGRFMTWIQLAKCLYRRFPSFRYCHCCWWWYADSLLL